MIANVVDDKLMNNSLVLLETVHSNRVFVWLFSELRRSEFKSSSACEIFVFYASEVPDQM